MVIFLKYVVKMMCFDEIFYIFLSNYFDLYRTNLGPVLARSGPNQTISARIKNEKKNIRPRTRVQPHSCLFDSSVLAAQSTHLCFLDYGYRKFFTNNIEFSMFLDLTGYERCHISNQDPKIKIPFLSKIAFVSAENGFGKIFYTLSYIWLHM